MSNSRNDAGSTHGPTLADLRCERDGDDPRSGFGEGVGVSLTGRAAAGTALDDAVVKDNLDAILLALVETTDGETHGKALMKRLGDLFGVHLSPGTLYPRLHGLEEAGLLRVHERVQTKEYRVADEDGVYDLIERRARQQLLLGGLLRDALVTDAEPSPESRGDVE
jgi:DNA-binding PadR family transcriptional regulator